MRVLQNVAKARGFSRFARRSFAAFSVQTPEVVAAAGVMKTHQPCAPREISIGGAKLWHIAPRVALFRRRIVGCREIMWCNMG
jgi:hypothetical protein